MNNKLILAAVIVIGLGIAYYFLYQYNYNEAKDTMALVMPEFMLTYATSANATEAPVALSPNPVIRELGNGGYCAFDDNLKALEERLGVEYSEAFANNLRQQTELALNKTVEVSQGMYKVAKDC